MNTHRLMTALLLSLIAAVGSAGARERAAEDGMESTIRSLRAGLAHVGYSTPAEGAVGLRWLGTGFLADRRCVVVTAKHLLQDVPADRLVVRFEDPANPGSALTFNARVSGSDPERDLGYLSVAELPDGTNACRASGLEPLRLRAGDDSRDLAGSDVLILGFPALEGEQPREVPIVRRGIVSSTELTWGGKAMLLLDLTGIPGFSGAPVALLRTGEVIGVVFGPGRTRREFDLEWATPISRDDLKRAGLE